jgi:hypothetical protein
VTDDILLSRKSDANLTGINLTTKGQKGAHRDWGIDSEQAWLG